MSAAVINLSPVIESQKLESVSASVINSFLHGEKELSAQELITALLQEPKLNDLYKLFAGVGEGYSVEEHTRMVVESFEKEFLPRPEIQEILRRNGLTSQQMMLFLALHDIGKGPAVKKIIHPTSERKKLELRNTQEIINEFAQQWNLGSEADIFIQLLSDDAIGDFLKKVNPSIADVLDTRLAISRAAGNCRAAGHFNMRDSDFLELKIVFHQVDAASYPFLRSRFFQTDSERKIQLGSSEVFWFLNYSVANLSKMQILQKEMGR